MEVLSMDSLEDSNMLDVHRSQNEAFDSPANAGNCEPAKSDKFDRPIKIISEAKDDERLEFIKVLNLIDTEPEQSYDAIVEIARRTFNIPIAIITLVSKSRIWFKAVTGIPVREISRHDNSFCYQAIQQEEPLIVLDALKDDRFKDLDIVQGGPQIRFYAAVPMLIDGGQERYGIGTLCVLDTKPHDFWNPGDSRLLQVLADSVVSMVSRRPTVHASGPLVSVDTEDGLEERTKALSMFFAISRREVHESVLRDLAQRLVARNVSDGEYIVREGAIGESMYFVVSGLCQCILDGKELERLGPGQCFGEMALLTRCQIRVRSSDMSSTAIDTAGKRAADVRALGRCQLLELRLEASGIITRVPNLLFSLQDVAARRRLRIAALHHRPDDLRSG